MVLFFGIFALITITNLGLFKLVIPYIYNLIGHFTLLIICVLCFYQALGLRALLAFVTTIIDYRNEYGSKKLAG